MIIPENLKFDFNGLFTLEMANNHQGSVEHGKRIIHEISKISHASGIRGAIKLQFRDLDTFIHPDYQEKADNRHIQRFLSTRLTEEEFQELVSEMRKVGMLTMCTPFDEPSVDLIKKMDFDIIKIGSPSAKDWPLLEKAAAAGKPMIVSVGGLSAREVDNIVSFLDHRYINFALMHCVSLYPTPIEKMNLKQVAFMRNRYPEVPIGLSSHEDPENTSVIQMAYARGARLFERHVGVPTDTITLNAYSSTPKQIERWISAYKEAVSAEGPHVYRPRDPDETRELQLLMRGVYAKRHIRQGDTVEDQDVFFAFPLQPGQLTSGEWKNGFISKDEYQKNAPLPHNMLLPRVLSKREIIYQAIHDVKGMLNQARIVIGNEFETELSHHYGIEKFSEIGAVIITCINRDYCKKIIIQLPGQYHPYHHHRKKEETFQILYGKLEVALEGKRYLLHPGDTITIQRGVRHSFWSEGGVIFEELSTTHLADDSVYRDSLIQSLSREERKTQLINWGRYQFEDV